MPAHNPNAAHAKGHPALTCRTLLTAAACPFSSTKPVAFRIAARAFSLSVLTDDAAPATDMKFSCWTESWCGGMKVPGYCSSSSSSAAWASEPFHLPTMGMPMGIGTLEP